MPSTVDRLSPSRVKLTIEIPFADLKPHLEKAYSDIARQVNIPGFRKGKVPAAIIDQRFGRGAVLQEAINAALPDAYSASVTENALVPLGQPDIDVTKLEDNDLIEFTAEVDVRPDFEVPAFSELSASVPVLAVTGDEVTERIEIMRQRFATRIDKDGAAAEGDVVTIDLVAAQDGEAVEDGTASDLTYKVGSGGMLEGLDDAVAGKSAGDVVTFTSQLVGGPAEGQQADITVTVTKVQTETLPEVDDEFAQQVSEFDTVDEMMADLAEASARAARVDQVNAASDAIVADLVAKTAFDLPEAMLTAEIANRKQSITEQLAGAGYTLERYLEDTEEETAADADEFWEQVAQNAETSLKAQIILEKVADEREVGVEQADLTEMIFRRAANSGNSPEQEMQHMMEHNHAAEWMGEIRRGKVLRMMVDEASITDESGAPVNVAGVLPDGGLDEEPSAPVASEEEASAPAASEEEASAPAASEEEASAPAASEEEVAEAKEPAKKASAKKAAKKKADDAAE